MVKQQNKTLQIIVSDIRCRRCDSSVEGTARRCHTCGASTRHPTRFFRRTSDYAFASAMLLAWWLIALNGFSTVTDAASTLCEELQFHSASLILAEYSHQCRINVSGGCMTCSWIDEQTHLDRLRRLRKKISQTRQADNSCHYSLPVSFGRQCCVS